jgi:hypothetical protein
MREGTKSRTSVYRHGEEMKIAYAAVVYEGGAKEGYSVKLLI